MRSANSVKHALPSTSNHGSCRCGHKHFAAAAPGPPKPLLTQSCLSGTKSGSCGGLSCTQLIRIQSSNAHGLKAFLTRRWRRSHVLHSVIGRRE